MGNIKRVVAGVFVTAAVTGALAIAGGATASAATAIEYGVTADSGDGTPDIVAGAYKKLGAAGEASPDATAIEYGLLAATPDIVAGAFK